MLHIALTLVAVGTLEFREDGRRRQMSREEARLEPHHIGELATRDHRVRDRDGLVPVLDYDEVVRVCVWRELGATRQLCAERDQAEPHENLVLAPIPYSVAYLQTPPSVKLGTRLDEQHPLADQRLPLALRAGCDPALAAPVVCNVL